METVPSRPQQDLVVFCKTIEEANRVINALNIAYPGIMNPVDKSVKAPIEILVGYLSPERVFAACCKRRNISLSECYDPKGFCLLRAEQFLTVSCILLGRRQ